MSKHPLKLGEKILLMIFGVFFVAAILVYIGIETVRLKSDTPLFEQLTHFDFSVDGKKGAGLYQRANCNACHRALRAGTSMGLSLDGIGSARSLEWLETFLANPEETYGARTIDHGAPPKEAAYVARLSEEDRRLIAIFLSELRADPGSSVAKVPPPGESPFIDRMLNVWAPDSWKEKYQDIREQRPVVEQE
jgi:cytochrome c553